MQEVFEKILDRLEEKENKAILKAPNTCNLQNSEYQKWMMKSYGFKEAKEIVREVAAEYEQKESAEHNNGWIPCSERLPTTEEYQRGNGRFLVTDGNRTYEAEFDIFESHTFGKSRMATDWFVTDKSVTHWQNEPLPPNK